MSHEPYRHVKVPGFGCTYPNDFLGDEGPCVFELRRLVKDEVIERSSELPTIILSIEAGKGSVSVTDNTLPLGYEELIVLPKGTSWSIAATTPILKILTIEVSAAIMTACCDEFNLAQEALETVFAELRTVTRTNWLNEVFHRYAFERSVAKQPTSASAAFLEAEIVKEIYYSVQRLAQKEHDVPYYIDLPEPLRRALTFIEQRMHDPLNADEIAAAAITSKPTLVRLFRTHLDTSPIKYLWNRRLDEADRLLMTGRYTVSEVASILGFSDSSTFSKSFIERFGQRPSSRLLKP